jgi:hypothetical protein
VSRDCNKSVGLLFGLRECHSSERLGEAEYTIDCNNLGKSGAFDQADIEIAMGSGKGRVAFWRIEE